MRKILLLLAFVALAGGVIAAVPSTTSTAGPYTCNGSTTAFAVGFPYLASSHLVVQKRVTVTGQVTTLVQGTDYNVAPGAGSSGTVTLTAGSKCGVGFTLTITRTVPVTQPTSLPSSGPVNTKTIETMADRGTQISQQIDRRLSSVETRDWTGPTGPVGPAGPQGPNGPSGAGPSFGNPGSVWYANTATGNDSNDCLTWTSACRTILGAYDKIPTNTGGTLYIAEGTYVGGEVANQGLWLMGSIDPQWNGGTVPAGWRKAKPVNFVGVGTTGHQFLKTPVATILGGQPGGGGWTKTDPNKPGIWLSGGEFHMRFQKLAIRGIARAMALGVPSNRDTSQPWVANVEFEDMVGMSWTGAGDEAIDALGPTVEIRYIFWTYFRRCYFHGLGKTSLVGYPAHNLTPERRGAAVWIDGGGPGNFENMVFAGGGIRVKGGTNWGTVKDVILEGDFVHAVPAAVYFESMDGYGTVYLENITLADAPGSDPTVVISTSSTTISGNVVANGVDSIQGPATILNLATREGYSNLTSFPTTQHQIGTAFGTLWGRHEGARRIGGAVPARFDNLVTSIAAGGNGADGYGAATITIGAVDPVGATTTAYAIRSGWITNVNSLDGTVLATSPTVTTAAGDTFLLGGWMQVVDPDGNPTTATPVSNVPGLQLSLPNGTVTTLWPFYNYQWAKYPFYGDGSWWWVSTFLTIATPAGGTGQITAAVTLTHGKACNVYGLVLHRIPAGTMTPNEIAEFAISRAHLPLGAKAGRVYAPQGMDVEITDSTRGVILRDGSGGKHRLRIDPSGAVTTSVVP